MRTFAPGQKPGHPSPAAASRSGASSGRMPPRTGSPAAAEPGQAAVVQSRAASVAWWAGGIPAALPPGGASLDPGVRARYEPGLGTSLAGVRVHAGAHAAALADSLEAEAYTVGRDIVFGAGRYRPGSPEGERLLAHELAHAVQQRGRAPTAAPPAVSRPESRAEREAGRAADDLLAGRPARLAPGSEPLAIHRQPRPPGQVRRADRFLPNEKARLRELGRGELDELIDRIIADGSFHEVRRETIDGVEHVWEVKTEIVELSEEEQMQGAKFGGALSGETTLTDPGGKKVRHRATYMLRGGRASTLQTALHELIHLRIMIDRKLPEEKRSSFYDEYAQLIEMTEVMAGTTFAPAPDKSSYTASSGYGALPIATGMWEKVKAVLARIDAIRSFFANQDPKAKAEFDKDPALTPAALVEFVVHEKYVTQTAARAVSGNAPGNETVATRYARAVVGRFEAFVSDEARKRITSSPVGTRQLADHTDALRLAIQRVYEALDQQLKEAREFQRNPPALPPPGEMLSPRAFETRPLDLGGQPVPLK